jgi:hypothetical protein
MSIAIFGQLRRSDASLEYLTTVSFKSRQADWLRGLGKVIDSTLAASTMISTKLKPTNRILTWILCGYLSDCGFFSSHDCDGANDFVTETGSLVEPAAALR